MATFGLIKSFQIDNGELEGLNEKECFVLGYELAQIDHLLATGELIEKPVHAANRVRIESACRDANRHFELKWSECDPSESWMILVVPPA